MKIQNSSSTVILFERKNPSLKENLLYDQESRAIKALAESLPIAKKLPKSSDLIVFREEKSLDDHALPFSFTGMDFIESRDEQQKPVSLEKLQELAKEVSLKTPIRASVIQIQRKPLSISYTAYQGGQELFDWQQQDFTHQPNSAAFVRQLDDSNQGAFVSLEELLDQTYEKTHNSISTVMQVANGLFQEAPQIFQPMFSTNRPEAFLKQVKKALEERQRTELQIKLARSIYILPYPHNCSEAGTYFCHGIYRFLNEQGIHAETLSSVDVLSKDFQDLLKKSDKAAIRYALNSGSWTQEQTRQAFQENSLYLAYCCPASERKEYEAAVIQKAFTYNQRLVKEGCPGRKSWKTSHDCVKKSERVPLRR